MSIKTQFITLKLLRISFIKSYFAIIEYKEKNGYGTYWE